MSKFLEMLAALFKSFSRAPAATPTPEKPSITLEDLMASTGARIDRALAHLPHIIATMAEYGIDTPTRKAAFLAQVGHESGGLRYTVEIWGPTQAQARYEGRSDLGNTQPGDGYRFRGRGLIQLTGRFNYMRATAALGVDLVGNPDLLSQSPLADRVAGWFWQSHGCNDLADSGDFEALTRRINGGLNGYAHRLALWNKARSVIV